MAAQSIAADEWEVYAPLHSSRVRLRLGRIEPLFPGYIFTNFDIDADDWPRICRTRGVYRILGRPGHPQPLPVGVIEELQRRTSERGVVDDPGSNINPYRPGEHVVLTEGPLAGLDGICEKSRGDRITLLLQLLGRPQHVTVPTTAVAPAA